MALNPISVETHVLSDWTLGDTLRFLSEGVFLRPSFQRAFVWDEELISELIRSVFLGYHIGSLLLWQVTDEQVGSMSLDPLYGVRVSPDQPNGKNDTVVVLDGQQRLTALHYAFFAPAMAVPDGRYGESPVAFFLRVDEFMRNRRGILHGASKSAAMAVECHPVHGGMADGSNPGEHLLPLPILTGGARPIAKWLDKYEAFLGERCALLEGETADLERRAQLTNEQSDLKAWDAKADELKEATQYYSDVRELDKALESVLGYKVQFVRLRSDESPDRVKDTFMQVNRRGKQLNNFELFSAEASWDGLNPRDLIEDAARELKDDRLDVSRERLQYFIPQLMLLRKHPGFVHDSAYSMQNFETYYSRFFLPGKDEALFEDVDEFKAAWEAAFDDLRAGLLALRDDDLFGAVDRTNYHCFALYDGLVPAFAAIWGDAHRVEFNAFAPLRDKKIQQWYWSRVFSEEPYMNAPSDVEWREREANAEMMVADYHDVMAWLAQPDNDLPTRPAVVRHTEQQMSPSQTRRLAHAHDREGEDPGNSRDRADTARYYSVLNFMNAIRPRQLFTGDFMSRNGLRTTEREVHVVGILTQEWADAKGGVSDKELGSPFNQILADKYSAEVMQLGVVPANHFLQIEATWRRAGSVPARYVDMLASHCISTGMYNALTAQTGMKKSNRVDKRLRDVPNKKLDRKLTEWRQGKRTSGENKNIDDSAFSVKAFKQFLEDREQRFLHAFGQHLFGADLSIGRTDRELLGRVVDLEGHLLDAIYLTLAKMSENTYLEKVEDFEKRTGRVSRTGRPADLETDHVSQRVKSDARSARRACRTMDEVKTFLAKRRWTLAHGYRFAEIFYNDLSQREKWPSGPNAQRTFLAHLNNVNKYRGAFLAHDGVPTVGPISVPRATRELGRDGIDALEKHWHLGST